MKVLTQILLGLGLTVGSVAAFSYDGQKMPEFVQERNYQRPILLPSTGGNTPVGIIANCFDREASADYTKEFGMIPAMLGRVGERNTIGVFADKNGRIQITLGDPSSGRVCILAVLSNVIFFDENSNPIVVP